MKTFAWRLLRQALATGERAEKYSTKIDQNCKLCNTIETDAHLFFECPFAKAVWFAGDNPIRTDNLPTGDQGVQAQLAYVLPSTSSPEKIQDPLSTIWHIWKTRNDS